MQQVAVEGKKKPLISVALKVLLFVQFRLNPTNTCRQRFRGSGSVQAEPPPVRSEHFIGVLTCFSSSPCGFFWHLKSFFFLFLFFCNCMSALLALHDTSTRSRAVPLGRLPAAVVESCPPGQRKVIFKWLIITICLRRGDLHKSPVVWRVSFTCSFPRLFPRGRQRRTDWVMKHTQKRHTIIDQKKLITVRA